MDNEEDSVNESESEVEFSKNESVEFKRDKQNKDPGDISLDMNDANREHYYCRDIRCRRKRKKSVGLHQVQRSDSLSEVQSLMIILMFGMK